MSRVVVLGQGYVGLPLALVAAEAGHDVVGLDTDVAVIGALVEMQSHVSDVTTAALQRAVASGRYRPTSDPAVIADTEVVIVCVPTPLDHTGAPDLSAVLAAADMIGRGIRGPALVVLESTTYPGTTREVFTPAILAYGHRLDTDVFVAFSPERVDPGNTEFSIATTPKVVGGVTVQSTERAREFYASFIDEVVVAKSDREAEMAKLLENTFRHINIALVNEMLPMAHEFDVDLWDAIRCAETKPFGFMAFRPGPGVGGHCIAVDPLYLSHRVRVELGYAFRMVEVADDINRAAPVYVASRCCEVLNAARLPTHGARVLLLGVTYKAGVADCRESPADVVARRLWDLGCVVDYHDPYVARWRPRGTELVLDGVSDLDRALATCDLAVLLQAHPQLDLDRVVSSRARILDTRGVLDDSLASVVRL